ncbi:MAG TPA: tRNA glutamyl-Q(34) synthetase GluQRS [Tepidisphaeraceae bacterium]|jgi:glutamyl-tRNA synthetase
MAVTRLAPSPTGALHLGNARTFLATWALARQRGWRVILRIEDLDGPRIKPEATQQAIDDLTWLGLDWDEGPIYQTPRLPRYREVLDRLIASGHVYPCVCTRREIEQAASAPHAEDGAAVYPGTCRNRSGADAGTAAARSSAWRFAMPDMTFEFRDDFAGVRRFDLTKQLGDFILAKPDGTPAYQLAVVVDDRDSGVTHVVRGDDLLDSVPRQALLYNALGWDDALPAYTHLPLVLGSDGRRLAKRHGDTRLSTYRASGLSADRVRGLLAGWLGLGTVNVCSPQEILDRFDLAKISREPIRIGMTGAFGVNKLPQMNADERR